MTTPPRKLGRGLTSLLNTPVSVAVSSVAASPNTPTPSATNPPDPNSIRPIGLSQILPNKYQPRKQFDVGSLERLAESIRSAGVMQPILVRAARSSGAASDGASLQYELVAGERRFRAAGLAGLATIPAIVVDITDEESAEWALIENMQRDDLATMEKAAALKVLSDRFNLTHSQISEKVGLDRSTVTNLMRLIELEPEITALLDQRRLSFGHGKALLACPPGPRRVEAARRASEDEWSVRKLERTVAAIAASTPGIGTVLSGAGSGGGDPTKGRDASQKARLENEAGVRDLEQQLSEHFGTKVELAVNGRGDKGRLIIKFYGLDHFDALMAKVGFQPK